MAITKLENTKIFKIKKKDETSVLFSIKNVSLPRKLVNWVKNCLDSCSLAAF